MAAYATVVNSEASVMRATVVALVYFGARALDHRTAPANVLALSGLLLGAVWPLSVFDAGFLLTFGATLGILLGVPPIVEALRTRWTDRRILTRIVLPVVAIGTATLCAEAALLPIAATAFGRISLAGLVLNFAAIPLMSVVQVAGAVASLSVSISESAARVPAYVAHVAAWSLVESARMVDVAPWLVIRTPAPSMVAVISYYASGAVWYRAPRATWMRRVALGAALASAAWIVTAGGLGTRSGPLRVTVLDVGQGDSTLVQFPNGHSMLVDAAGANSFDLGERVLAPAIWAHQVSRLDWLVVTHGDPDHIGSATSVMRILGPRELWEGVPVPRQAALDALKETAARAGRTWRQVVAGDRLWVGGVEVRVLHPPRPDWERRQVRNDDSVVLEIRCGDVSLLLPGDIGSEVESLVVDQLEPVRWRIVKMPHHGSGGSSGPDFVRAAQPVAVIVSAGAGNRYGHPDATALDHYRRARAAVFRTDEDGAVTVTTDGRGVEIATMTGRRRRFGGTVAGRDARSGRLPACGRPGRTAPIESSGIASPGRP